jgi:hypothetical protein
MEKTTSEYFSEKKDAKEMLEKGLDLYSILKACPCLEKKFHGHALLFADYLLKDSEKTEFDSNYKNPKP